MQGEHQGPKLPGKHFFHDALLVVGETVGFCLLFGGLADDGELINEKSPYLLQHANNPVDWYP